MRFSIIIFAIVTAIFCRVFLISVYKVPTYSMAPLILAGDFILASQISYTYKFPATNKVYYAIQPKHGELVVYSKNNRVYIKRVLATSGEQFEYKNVELSINGKKCEYINRLESTESKIELITEVCNESKRLIYSPLDKAINSQNLPKTTLLKDQFLVGGDNRSIENNPNAVEIINYDQIVGKPQLIWMSYSSTQDFISKTLGVRWNRILTILK